MFLAFVCVCVLKNECMCYNTCVCVCVCVLEGDCSAGIYSVFVGVS